MRALPGAAGPPTSSGPLDMTLAPRIVLKRPPTGRWRPVNAGLMTSILLCECDERACGQELVEPEHLAIEDPVG